MGEDHVGNSKKGGSVRGCRKKKRTMNNVDQPVLGPLSSMTQRREFLNEPPGSCGAPPNNPCESVGIPQFFTLASPTSNVSGALSISRFLPRVCLPREDGIDSGAGKSIHGGVGAKT